ncbi:spidroin-1-like isoform X1 [Bicyclus anynana]|uniref:Spidroin-1-like isoform X1 n=1 Tax=Bicyclus anynana TaxID=110368 RepID=A0ABM3LPL8_BICAN|nr:spidroin-1-like isoform X1 [Bicyclus anynana]
MLRNVFVHSVNTVPPYRTSRTTWDHLLQMPHPGVRGQQHAGGPRGRGGVGADVGAVGAGGGLARVPPARGAGRRVRGARLRQRHAAGVRRLRVPAPQQHHGGVWARLSGVEAHVGGHHPQRGHAGVAAHHGLRLRQMGPARGAGDERRGRGRARPVQVLRWLLPRLPRRRVPGDGAGRQRVPRRLRVDDRVAGRGAPHPGQPAAGRAAGGRRRVAGAAGLRGGLLAHVGALRLPALLPAAAVPLAAAREHPLAGGGRPAARGRPRHQAGRQGQPRLRARGRARQDAGEGPGHHQGRGHRRGGEPVHGVRQVRRAAAAAAGVLLLVGERRVRVLRAGRARARAGGLGARQLRAAGGGRAARAAAQHAAAGPRGAAPAAHRRAAAHRRRAHRHPLPARRRERGGHGAVPGRQDGRHHDAERAVRVHGRAVPHARAPAPAGRLLHLRPPRRHPRAADAAAGGLRSVGADHSAGRAAAGQRGADAAGARHAGPAPARLLRGPGQLRRHHRHRHPVGDAVPLELAGTCASRTPSSSLKGLTMTRVQCRFPIRKLLNVPDVVSTWTALTYYAVASGNDLLTLASSLFQLSILVLARRRHNSEHPPL